MGSQAIFQSERTADLLLSTLFTYRDQGKFLVHEFVLMPNHLHILLTPSSNVALERAMQFIKGGFSHRAGKELGITREIWQRGYVAIASAMPKTMPVPAIHSIQSCESSPGRNS